MPRLALACLMLIGGLTSAAGAAGAEPVPTAGFSLGRGGTAAKLAVDLQRELRRALAERKDLAPVDLDERLNGGAADGVGPALTEARTLFQAGKAAYEEVDLEAAQQKFDEARERLESQAAWLDDPGLLRECLVYLGASWVLSGEIEKGIEYFSRALDLSREAGIDRDVFPPDIQAVFDQAKQRSAEGPRGALSVSVEPMGAEVYLDLAYRGGAPLQMEELRPGPHLLAARKDGYLRFSGALTVEAGRTRVLRVALKPARDQKAFSEKFAGMAREAFGKGPDAGSAALAEFLGVQRLILATLDGDASALRLRVFSITPGAPPHIERREAAGVSAADLGEKTRELLGELLDAGAGAPVAAGGAEETGLEGLVVDGEGDGSGAAKDAVSAGSDASGGLAAGGTAGDGAIEGASGSASSDRVRPTTETPPPPWYSFAYLRDKWWFWTAVGVLTVGAAAGIGAAAAPGEERGTLRIRIH